MHSWIWCMRIKTTCEQQKASIFWKDLFFQQKASNNVLPVTAHPSQNPFPFHRAQWSSSCAPHVAFFHLFPFLISYLQGCNTFWVVDSLLPACISQMWRVVGCGCIDTTQNLKASSVNNNICEASKSTEQSSQNSHYAKEWCAPVQLSHLFLQYRYLIHMEQLLWRLQYTPMLCRYLNQYHNVDHNQWPSWITFGFVLNGCNINSCLTNFLFTRKSSTDVSIQLISSGLLHTRHDVQEG